MFQLLSPVYLWALLGLIIPIAIHLWNRKEGRVIKVGSIQWLQASPSSRFSSIKFHDLLLFILRSLLILLLVLILTGLQKTEYFTAKKKPVSWVLVEHSILQERFILQDIDSLKQIGYEARLLEPGFPLMEEAVSHTQNNTIYNYWSLLKEVEKESPVPEHIIVYSRSYLKNFEGKRPVIAIDIEWITVPKKNENIFLAEALQTGDSVKLKIGITHESITYFEEIIAPVQNNDFHIREPGIPTIKVTGKSGQDSLFFANLGEDSLKVKSPNPLIVILSYTKDFENVVKYLKAALASIGQFRKEPIILHTKPVEELNDSIQADWVFWLSGQKLPASVNADYMAVMDKGINQVNMPWFPGFKIYHGDDMTRPIDSLHQDISLVDDLPGYLMKILYPEGVQAQNIIDKDRRIISKSQQQVKVSEKPSVSNHATTALIDLHLPLWILLSLTFIAERYLSGKKQM